MRIVKLEEIRANLELDAVITAIRAGFVSFSAGEVEMGAVGHLHFPKVNGDCHIKSAAMVGSDVFAVKVATGFPQNPERGLAASDGMMIVLEASTGIPLGLLFDEGYLTDVRTAIAGGLAAALIRPAECDAIGILGTGIQARFQAELAMRITGVHRVIIWGRDQSKAAQLAAGLEGEGATAIVATDLPALTERTRLVISATNARTPLLTRGNTVPGMRIVAIGADAPGKQEVDTELVASMDLLVADSISQCLDYGELSWPAKSGQIDTNRIAELGKLLAKPPILSAESSALVDLTGVGIQDLQIAAAVWQRVHATDQTADLL